MRRDLEILGSQIPRCAFEMLHARAFHYAPLVFRHLRPFHVTSGLAPRARWSQHRANVQLHVQTGRVHFHSVALWMMRRENDAPLLARRKPRRAAFTAGETSIKPRRGSQSARNRSRLCSSTATLRGTEGGKTEKLFWFRESKRFPLLLPQSPSASGVADREIQRRHDPT